MPTRCSPRRGALPGRRRHRRARRRGGDEHAAVGLLGSGQAARQAADRRGDPAGRDGAGAQPRAIRRRQHLYIHLMENERRSAARRSRRRPARGGRWRRQRRPPRPHAGAHLLRLGRFGRFDPRQCRCRRGPTRPRSGPAATRVRSATAIIRTTSTSSSPRRRWPATCRRRSREARRLAAIVDPETGARSPGCRRSMPRPISPLPSSRRRRRSWRWRAPDARLPYRRRRCATMRAPWPTPSSATAPNSRRRWPGSRRCAPAPTAKPMVDQGVPAPDLLELAENVARARWAFAAGRYRRGRRPLSRGDRDRGSHALHGAALVVLSGPPVARRRFVPRRPL